MPARVVQGERCRALLVGMGSDARELVIQDFPERRRRGGGEKLAERPRRSAGDPSR